MKTKHLALAAALLFTAPGLLAQTCSKLAVTGSGKAGTSLTFNYSGGHKRSLVWLAAGEKTGSTSIKIGSLGTLNLGLATPFVFLPVGRTDGDGDFSLKLMVPKGLKEAHKFHVQMTTSKLTISRNPFKISLDFCPSNVLEVSIGGT